MSGKNLGFEGAKKKSDDDLVLKFLVQPMVSGPCLSSLLAPPLAQNNCMQWVANISAAPTYDSALDIIFTGSGDEFLHVIERDTAQVIARIPSTGRVVTQVIFSSDRSKIYFGTDQGLISAHDAFMPFKKLFSFQADSRINNDLILADNALVFSTGLASVYKLDSNLGHELWHLDRPMADALRIKLESFSNLIFLSPDILIAPHPDGFVSILDFAEGTVRHTIDLTKRDGHKRPFPDIVAPMLYIGHTLWVASFDFGVTRIDPKRAQVLGHNKHYMVQQMASDSERIYLASSNYLMAMSLTGETIWKNDLALAKKEDARYGFPFVNFNPGSQRVFNGLPSRLLLNNASLIMATSLGAMAKFNLRNGAREQVVGNSLGFGPKINFLGEDGVLAMTPRGSLALFLFAEKLRKGGTPL